MEYCCSSGFLDGGLSYDLEVWVDGLGDLYWKRWCGCYEIVVVEGCRGG